MRHFEKVLAGAACTVLAFMFPAIIIAQEIQQTAASQEPAYGQAASADKTAVGPSVEDHVAELPDSPGVVQSQQNSSSQPAISQNPATSSPVTSSPQSQPAESTQETKPQRPVGTAAAEAPMVTGVTAAQPAGVAIAPAKQRRVRTIVLKVGAIVGAGVALGTVAALRLGTPSKPPGAH
jgi:hypothetical protein